MRRTLILLTVLLAAASGHAQDMSSLARRLTFETDHPGGTPAGWTNPSKRAFADDKVVRTGRWSARLEGGAPGSTESTVMAMTLPLEVDGKSLVLRGFVRTEDVSGFVAVWIREDGEAPNLAFATTQNRQVRGTNDWQEHSVTVPIHSDARRLTFAVVLSGSGTAWADDFELLVDGAPFSAAPKAERLKTIVDRDTEFNSGSRIKAEALTATQADSLFTLGKVWGFLKYHHPAVRSGSKQWDFELFRVMPGVLAAADRAAANALMARWVSGLGTVADCTTCAELKKDALYFAPDVAWLGDEARLGAELSQILRRIYANRPVTPGQFYVSLVPSIGNPQFQNEPVYATATLPDAGFQLLGLYRFWNIIEYWFPNRDIIGEPWDNVLREFVPRFAAAKAAGDYHRQLLALIARVHDTHANLWSTLSARPPLGDCQIPVIVRFIENRPVVTAAADTFERGDVIVALDNVPVTQLVKEWSPFYAASNEPTRFRDIAASMTRGTCGDTTVRVSRNGAEQTLNVARVTTKPPSGAPTHDLPGETFRKLSADVAYLKLSSVAGPDVPKYLEGAAGTKGLVIDIRNYPSAFVVFALGQALVGDEMAFARFTMGDPVNPGAFHWGPMVSLKPSATRYKGQVVILVDEVSQSQAEYTAMAFRIAPGAKVVGSTTAGADGNVSAIPLPGNVHSMISGIGVFYPDKRPTQRIGIVPDIEVRPTIAGIRAGRDEVLEAAIRQIVGAAVPLAEIQKMIAAAR